MTGPDPARRVGSVCGVPAVAARPVAGGDICDAYRVELADGDVVFVKTLAGAPADFFAAEAAGLELLRATDTVPVPRVLAATADLLALEWIEPAAPSAAQAERLGRELAALHATPAPHYGGRGPLYLGPLRLGGPQSPATAPADWPAFHAEHRLLPALRLAVDNGGIAAADRRAVETLCERLAEVAGPPQPPAVIHGDLWSGNVLWTAGERAHLIDPAAQGGHPEVDLALLEGFGCPHFDRLIAAYQEVRPLPGRAARAPLHLLHPMLVHAALFGGGYGARSGALARAALRSGGG